MKKIIQSLRSGALALALLAAASSAWAQFAEPACNPKASDSTCFSNPGATCFSQPAAATQACPAGYYGQGEEKGTRDSCTSAIVWDPATQDQSGCTNCPNPLSAGETQAMQNAVLAQVPTANQRFFDWACPTCSDGAAINNPVNGLATGRAFRGRVWVPDAFASGQLPTINRVNYLAQSNQLVAFMPAIPGVQDNNSQTLYKKAVEASATVAVCSNNDKDHCDMTCGPAGSGWLDKFCDVKQVQFNASGCSGAWEVMTAAGWRPTKDVAVPYTAPNDFTMKTWRWDDVVAWNAGNPAGSTSAYMCNSAPNFCAGWQTQSSTKVCASSHSETVYDAKGLPAGTVTVCDSYVNQLSQFNDCDGASRVVAESALPASCGGSAPTPATCSGGMAWNGSQCSCPAGQMYNGSSCVASCSPTDGPQACPGNLTGAKTVRTYCDGSQTTVSDTCQCVNTASSTSCGAGFTGNKTITNDCNGNLVSSDSSQCVAIPPPPPPPPPPSSNYGPWMDYCDTTVQTPNPPGDPNYEETSEWGWRRYDLNTGLPDIQVEGTNSTRGQAQYSSTPNGSQSCWTPGAPPSGSPPPACNNTSATQACGAGFTGNKTVVTDCNGNVVSTDTSQCAPVAPPPSCNNTSSTQACGVGFTGNKTVVTDCNGNVVSTDTSQCAPAACPTTYAYPACDAGFTGTKTVATDCNGNSSVDTSGCSPAAPVCQDPVKYCNVSAQNDNTSNDMYYSWGEIYFEGADCHPVDYPLGSASGSSLGGSACPVGYQ